MTDSVLGSLIGEVLASTWLVPLLGLAVVLDGPFLPSEPILFGAALVGSLLGDALLYTAGRSSHRILRTARRDEGIGAWVRRHLHDRPIVALLAVRLIPGGRLASVTAAGRVRLSLPAFLPATLVSSVVWCTYMTGVGLVIGPVTGGDPLLSLLAGLVSATVIGAVVATVRRARRRTAVDGGRRGR